MNSYGLEFHHFGLATRYPQKALQFHEGLGYQFTEEIFDPEQKVMLRLGTHAVMPTIELVYLNHSDYSDTPLADILKQRTEMNYHTCYTSANPDRSLHALKQDCGRVLCLSPAKPAILFQGLKVSFYYLQGIGLIELLDMSEQL